MYIAKSHIVCDKKEYKKGQEYKGKYSKRLLELGVIEEAEAETSQELDIDKMNIEQLRELAEELEIDHEGVSKDDLKAAIKEEVEA